MVELTSILLVLLAFTCSSASVNPHEYRASKESWIKASGLFQDYSWPLMTPFTKFLDEVVEDDSIDLNPRCRYGLHTFSSGLKTFSYEAVTLFDSFGKMQSGFTKDKIVDFGHYDQCLNAKINGSSSRYTLLQIEWPTAKDHQIMRFDDESVEAGLTNSPNSPWYIEFSKRMGFLRFWPSLTAVCIPSACQLQDIENVLKSDLVNKTISPFKLSVYNHESLEDEQTSNHPILKRVSRIILWSLFAMTILSTGFLYFFPGEPTSEDCLLVHFDIINNVKKLVTPSQNIDKMYIFNNVKTFYLFGSIFCHCYSGIIPKSLAYYSGYIMYAMESEFKLDIEWENYAVAINFVISGCMASLSLIPILKIKRVSLSNALVLRALRTLPVVVACILVVFSLPLLPTGSGPLANLIQSNMTENCVKNAWRDITFTSNSVPLNEACMTVNWFTAADFQLFAMSFFLIGIMATKSGRTVAKYFIAFVLFGWTIKALFLQLYSDIPVTFTFSQDWFNNQRQISLTQFNTITYMGPYSVGLLLGYLLNNEIFLVPKKYLKLLFIVCLGVGMSIASMLAKLYDISEGSFRSNYSRTTELAFAASSRTFLGFAFAGILYCLYMNGVKEEEEKQDNEQQPDHFVVAFLKNNLFNIVARLSFSTFMVHMFVIAFMQSSFSQVTNYNQIEIAMKGTYVSVISLLPGLAMYLVVEAPFFNIFKTKVSRKTLKRSESVKVSEKEL